MVYADVDNILGGKRTYYREEHKILIIANKEIRLEVTMINLSIWSYLQIRMQYEVTI